MIETVYTLDGGILNQVSNLNGDAQITNNANYALMAESASKIDLIMSTTDFKLKAVLKDRDGNSIYTSNIIDLPLESVVVNGSYDSSTKEVVLTLENGNKIKFSVVDLISGLVSYTDYATSDVGGVVRVGNAFGLSNSGIAQCTSLTYADYQARGNANFISKGTLENVFDGKGIVKNTDYATASKGGVVKISNTYGTYINNGILAGTGITYEQFNNANNGLLVSKTTLVNVLDEKLGDINNLLDIINGEEV